jgi:SAM-dependent methyltransferase
MPRASVVAARHRVPGLETLIRLLPVRQRVACSPEEIPVPPPPLRERVSGTPDEDVFLNVGEACAGDLAAALRDAGWEMQDFRRVLDFGCGAGRVLKWFAPLAASCQFYGTDIDTEAIEWCRRNLPFAKFSPNSDRPPLPYRRNFFDLVYAVSVFTHLNQHFQWAWLSELHRVIRRGGVLIASLHGRYDIDQLPGDLAQRTLAVGFMFSTAEQKSDPFPFWYQTAFHTEEYVRTRWTQHFDVLRHIPRGLNNHQDLVILKRK